MKRTLLSLALLAAVAVGGATAISTPAPAQAATIRTVTSPDPVRQIHDTVRLFRNGDVATLAQSLTPPAKWEEIRLAYELQRLKPTTDEQREKFAELVDNVTATDAVDRFMADIEPKLIEARPQLPGALLMGFGAAQMAIASPDSDLTDEQRETLRNALPGVQAWIARTDVLSSELMREALTLLTAAARRTGITDIDQLKGMPLEAALDHASTLLAGAKDAARVYGVDIDQIADSLHVDVLEQDATTAKVRTTVTVFGAPVWTDVDLVLVDGRWYSKQTFLHMDSDVDIELDDEDAEG